MKGAKTKRELPAKESEALLGALQARFEKNQDRHAGLAWAKVEARLKADPGKLWSLAEMERTGGEPDVVGFDKKTGEVIFFDCSPESPAGRRSVCYDREGLESRKDHPPKNTAIDMANEIGVQLLDEEQYLQLQKLGEFDTKTSSWILTPAGMRDLGGALCAMSVKMGAWANQFPTASGGVGRRAAFIMSDMRQGLSHFQDDGGDAPMLAGLNE